VEERELGRSGLRVSRIVLGCGNFGGVGSAPDWFGRGTGEEEAFRIMDAAWEQGITTFDTADAYGGGRSESFIGAWLRTKSAIVRERIVLQTKTFNPMDSGHDSGLSRSRIRRQIESSLRRLGVESVGLYLAHEFDPVVPPTETVLAFDELVREGKVGVVGASNFDEEQLADAVGIAERDELVRYECVQNGYSLLERRDRERVIPFCRDHGIGYQAFSPLAGGWLTGKYRRGEEPPPGSRMTQRPESYVAYRRDSVFSSVEALERESAERGVSAAALALAWLLAQPDVTAVVIGPGRAQHLEPVDGARRVQLSAEERDALTELFE
jgi:aryl-alcohol dehydrogenase-like predicted oxidoreductase